MTDLSRSNRRGNSQLDEIERELVRMKTRLSQIPSKWAGESQLSLLYRVLGGNTLATLGLDGIRRRSDAVAGSEMPAGTGGTSGDIIDMPANGAAIPAMLPNGVGIAQSVSDGSYVWLILDNTGSASLPSVNLAVPDLLANEIVALLISDFRYLDKVVGGVTYRYACRIPSPGWW